MREKRSKLLIAVLVFLILNLCATAVLGWIVLSENGGEALKTKSQYVMYIGTNDKDTYTQLIPTADAKELIDSICFKYLDGYTIQDATGAWVDEVGAATHENTIVCYFDGADEETVYRIADEVLTALNQNSVLIEKEQLQIEYYSGS